MFALVTVKGLGSRRFTYRIPEGLPVDVGTAVVVHVKGKPKNGVVVQLLADCPLPEDRIRDLALPGDQAPAMVANPRPEGPVQVPRVDAPIGEFKVSKKALFSSMGYIPHRGQEPIHGSFERPEIRTVVAVCGTRFGKTMAAAHEMAYEALRPRQKTTLNPDGDFKGWCVGPTYKIADIVFTMIVRILHNYLKGHIRVNKTDGEIEFTNLGGTNSIIRRRTTEAGKGRLVGEAVDFMVIDEAASIRDPDIWDGDLRTRLMDRGGRSLHISSPRGVVGYFASMFNKRDSDASIAGFQLPSWTNPHLPRAEILYLKRSMPARRFAAEVGAELLADSGMVFAREDLEKMFVLGFEQPLAGADYFASIDLAVTNDFTVLTIARAPMKGEKIRVPRIVLQERFYKIPIEAQLSRMHATLEAYGGCTAVVDHNGIGQSIYQQMVNRGMSVRPLYTTGSGKNSKKDLVFNAAAIVERTGILAPTPDLVPNFFDEMSKFQWEETPSGALTANAPAGAHDDTVAGFVLLCSWIPAAGTSGDGQVHHAGGEVEKPPLATSVKTPTPRPEMIVRGDAVPSDEDDDVAYNPPSRGRVGEGRRLGLGNRLLRGGGLFRPW